MGNRHAFCNSEVTDNPKKLFVWRLPVFREGPAAPPAWLPPVRKFELACVDFYFQIASSFAARAPVFLPRSCPIAPKSNAKERNRSKTCVESEFDKRLYFQLFETDAEGPKKQWLLRWLERAPDKGEVGGSSPPRPTIQIASKYAAILTFYLRGNISQKNNLPTICQL